MFRPRQFDVRTDDGRRLVAEVAGPEDGELLLLHPGTPSSRVLYDRHLREAADRGLRHVIYSRPGYHGSDRHPGRSYADSAIDSAAVVDALEVDSFYTLGVSGGGGPALACAALLPDRVRSAASVAALGPREGEGLDWLRGVVPSSEEEFEALEQGERELLAYLQGEMDGMAEAKTHSQMIRKMEAFLCAADVACLNGDFLKLQLTARRQASRDCIWGWFDDDWAMWKDWGFDLAAITVPVTIWQGGLDKLVPPQNGTWLATHTAGAELRFHGDEGHISLFGNHYGAMLDDLIASARS